MYIYNSQEVEQLIQAALSKYSADRIAKFDFALENAGGSVIADKSSPTYSLALADVRLFGLKLWTVSTSRPSNIIQVTHVRSRNIPYSR